MRPIAAGTFAPAAGPAKAGRMFTAQTVFELRLVTRNGEQMLLALIIPVVALIVLSTTTLIDLPAPRVAVVVPGIWTLAIVSSGFTSLSISTAFDRRYAVTKRLIGSGVPRRVLLAGKAAAIGIVVAGQLVILGVIAVLLGWRPVGTPATAFLVVVLGVAAFTGLGLLLGGTMKAELVLAVANLVWLAFVAVGGVVVPLTGSPGWLAVLGQATPAGALSTALRSVLAEGAGPPAGSLLVLAGWALAGWGATLNWFKWQ